jgi:hypothetical protein
MHCCSKEIGHAQVESYVISCKMFWWLSSFSRMQYSCQLGQSFFFQVVSLKVESGLTKRAPDPRQSASGYPIIKGINLDNDLG